MDAVISAFDAAGIENVERRCQVPIELRSVVRDTGAALDLKSNTLTPLLKRLEESGLVRRRRDAKDERQVRVRLTDKCKALEHEAADIPTCVLQALDMSQEDLRATIETVNTVRERLRAATETPA